MTEDDVKQRILAAVAALLDEGQLPERITVRNITERAGVGTGSVNYHFRSKDELLRAAVMGRVLELGQRWVERFAKSKGDPRRRLKTMLLELLALMVRYPQYTRFFVNHELLNGDMGAARVLLPVLRQIVGPNLDELRLRLLAFQLMVPLQYAFLREDALRSYLGVGPLSDVSLMDLVDILFENLVPEMEGDS
jgi:TetR/AcrR family transcriptional regulator, regulator of cefoperazone and chloramphenicol sensitivity